MRTLAVILLMASLAACSDAFQRGFTLENQADVPVSVVYLTAQGESTVVTDLPPGKTDFLLGFPGSPCGDMTLVARGPDGSEVARRTGRTCLDDRWKIVRASPSN